MSLHQGFSYQGQPTTLQAGDEMYYNVTDHTISFFRRDGTDPDDNDLLMGGDDKFLLYSIRHEEDFWRLALLIGVLHGLQFTSLKTTTGPLPLYRVKFHK